KNMQSIKSIVLRNARIKVCADDELFQRGDRISWIMMKRKISQVSAQMSPENFSCLTDRVIELVKKFDSIDANKVSETADFEKDLCLDSLDKVELVMAFEKEFSIEIPDDKADKINSCADAIKYIASQPKYNVQ
ncbi:hypothetical protein KI387_001507, partial [Taxus chinensis]